MSFLDTVILSSAFLGSGVYLILHLIIFRFVAVKDILPWLMRTYFLGAIAVIFMPLYLGWVPQAGNLNLVVTLSSITLAILIYSLACFFYVLNIYGPYESSLSVRLLREFYKVYPKALTRDEILAAYSAKEILKTRLERLTGSGEVISEEGNYRVGKKQNVFFILQFAS